jgi:hypothetical protein
MPVKSKAQMRFMEGIAHGMTPRGGKGPSKAVAEEFVSATKTTKGLPERKAKKKTKYDGDLDVATEDFP